MNQRRFDFTTPPEVLAEAERLKAEAITRVGDHADAEWWEVALLAVRHVCSTRARFTTDDIWARLERPREARAMGAVMTAAARLGWCEQTAEFARSTRPVCHRRPVQVWRSRLALVGA